MAKRVFLHVGTPKSGTTFLQQVLWSHRQQALDQGLLLPLETFYEHFLATADVRGLATEARYPPRAVGTWGRLVDEGTAWDGNVLVSHELFAGATAEQAERAVLAWGAAEVHVIVTARDLERQIPAEWQEHLKHRSSVTFSDFIEDVWSRGELATWFWTVQDYADVCRRWASAVPANRVHVVTVPRRGAAPDVLWRRFAGLLGLEPAAFDLASSRTNTSLRAEQAELLRRINAQLGERLPIPGPYPPTVKEIFAQDVLAGRAGVHVALWPKNRAHALSRSQDLVEQLRQLDVDVVGDLAELVPADDPSAQDGLTTEHPEELPAEVLLAESVEALDEMLDRFSKERERLAETSRKLQQVEAEIGEGRAELVALTEMRSRYEQLVHDMRHRPLHHLVIGMSEQRPWVMKVRVAYWRTANAARWIARRGSSG